MARWPREKLNQRLEDLRARLTQGQTLEQIARAWGTTKQNVSQFRKRYLSSEGTTPAADTGQQAVLPEAGAPSSVVEDYSLYAKAYQTIVAQERMIQELEAQLRDLRLRLYTLQQSRAVGDRAKESLKRYLDARQS